MHFFNSPQQVWEKGACRDAPDKDIFYPDRDAATYSEVADRARRYCRGDTLTPACPVLLECLFYGLVTEDNFGIWGGMSPRERNALRRTGTLSKYRSAELFSDSPYYVLIENYLERRAREEDSQSG